MISSELKQIANNEMLQIILLIVIACVNLYIEIGLCRTAINSVVNRLILPVRKLVSISKDYRRGIYYKPWKPNHAIIVVSTKPQIAELSEAAALSQRAVYADMFGFKHTMNKFEHNTSDHKVVRTRLYSRLLLINGPGHMKAMFPHLTLRLRALLDTELAGEYGMGVDKISLPLAQTVRRLASGLMGVIFFGEKLSADDLFATALLQYPQDMVKCMAAFQITPSFMSPLVHAILTKRGRAMTLIQNKIKECIESGLDEIDAVKHYTLLHNMVELSTGSEYWNAELLSQSLLGIWFAASHQPWMNLHFVLIELCKRPEWQDALRQELLRNSPLDFDRLEGLVLLDGFIKETVRLNPLDTCMASPLSLALLRLAFPPRNEYMEDADQPPRDGTVAVRRKALQNYTFSHGSVTVPSGATVCVSSQDLMHDPQTYPEPYDFDPTRYSNKQANQQHRKFTDISEKFPVWGYGSLACPGRLQASMVMKIILAELLLSYDLCLECPSAQTRWRWETFTMPFQSTRIVLHSRT